MEEVRGKKKIGLCLSGGGALGYAHIGALKAFMENNIHPDVISGTSMGAIIGALYANNIHPDKMMQIVRDKKLYKLSSLLNPSLINNGISSHKNLKKILNESVPNNFESLAKEYYVCASNVNKAEWVIIGEGNLLHEYIIASSSIPFVFESIEIEGHTYVDGGLFNNLPAQALKGKCDIIIGIDVLPYFEKAKVNKTNELIILSIRGIEHHNSHTGRKLCNYLIESPAIKKYNEFSFDKYEEIYKIGYETTLKYILENSEFAKLGQN